MGNNRIYHIVADFLVSLFKSMRFAYHLLRENVIYGNHSFVYNERLFGKRVYVLANGPSLNAELSELLKDECFFHSPKFVLNFFVKSDLYCQIRPEYYCIADPVFFNQDSEQRDVVIEKLNKETKWGMELFVPVNGFAIIQKKIENDYIRVTPIPVLIYEGFERRRFLMFKRGKAAPSFVNVTIMIEYILLNLGCKDIRLYGVDHTFTDGLYVNDDNQLCIEDNHFYGKSSRQIIDWYGKNVSVANYLKGKYLTFKEHELMRSYADYLGAQIINCTECSLIDAYTRLSQIKKERKIE